MGVVVLGQPAGALTLASSFSRITTEARVMHKAVKKMQKHRPKKVVPKNWHVYSLAVAVL